MAQVIYWYGASQTPHVFQLFPVGTQFPPVPAVYVCARQQPDGAWAALYVGETDSIQRRLNADVLAHDGYRRALTLGATHIGVKVVGTADERLRIETDLRHGQRPPANAQGILGALG